MKYHPLIRRTRGLTLRLLLVSEDAQATGGSPGGISRRELYTDTRHMHRAAGEAGHKGKGRAGERACQGEQIRAANHRDSGQYLVGRGGGGLLYTLLGNISRSHWYRSPW